MVDFLFDFYNNDMMLSGDGDFLTGGKIGNQDGTLILMKTCLSYDSPTLGVNFGSLYANSNQADTESLIIAAKNQIKADGAVDVEIISELKGSKGEYNIQVTATYPTEL